MRPPGPPSARRSPTPTATWTRSPIPGADYAAARTAFRAAVADADGDLDPIAHPGCGPDGDDLSTDVAWFGPRDAENVLVTISGTHGVEGFCGSGAQVDFLRRGEARRLPPDTAMMLVHAINPHGFAWLRRVTEDNVDLNRNWVDHAGPLPENPGYTQLRDVLCPAEWTEDTRADTKAQLEAYAGEHGAFALQEAFSKGQYADPDGVFYGGAAPTWSRRTQTAILRERLAGAARVAIIDYHTGLGPWGFGEQIVIGRSGEPGFERARRWYGATTVSPMEGDSSSADITGDGLSAAPALLPHAEVTGMALEIGTVSMSTVRDALRADAWLHAHADPTGPEAAPIKAQMRAAFYGDADDWKGMVAGQSLLVCRQALAGLSGG